MPYDELITAVIAGDAELAAELTRAALDAGADPEEILSAGLVPAIEVVGQQFSIGEIYVPDMLVAARAMKFAIAILQPILAAAKHEPRGTVVIGTVKGDVHDVGKNIVAIMLEGSGFDVCDLGVDVAAATFVEAVTERRPDILALSALLTTTMPVMKDVIDALASAGVRERVRVMVGGAPVTPEFAREIGADVYAPDAGAAGEAAGRLIATGVATPED